MQLLLQGKPALKSQPARPTSPSPFFPLSPSHLTQLRPPGLIFLTWVGTGWKASSQGEILDWVPETVALFDKPLTGCRSWLELYVVIPCVV